jgi:hypothetical protein
MELGWKNLVVVHDTGNGMFREERSRDEFVTSKGTRHFPSRQQQRDVKRSEDQ